VPTSSAASTAVSILAELSAIVRARKNRALMLDGVTLEDPGAVYVDDDVTIGSDTTIGPNVVLQGPDDDRRPLSDSRRRAADRRDHRRRRGHSRSHGDCRIGRRGWRAGWPVRARPAELDDRRAGARSATSSS
jgi:hypothetical protein